jgi:hypothetical protein
MTALATAVATNVQAITANSIHQYVVGSRSSDGGDEDEFRGGVLSTRSAWVIWISTPVWLGLEPGRKLNPSPRLAFGISDIHEQVN